MYHQLAPCPPYRASSYHWNTNNVRYIIYTDICTISWLPVHHTKPVVIADIIYTDICTISWLPVHHTELVVITSLKASYYKYIIYTATWSMRYLPNFHWLEFVGRGRETQLQVVENPIPSQPLSLKYMYGNIKLPLSKNTTTHHSGFAVWWHCSQVYQMIQY